MVYEPAKSGLPRVEKPMEYIALPGEVIRTTIKAVLVSRENVYGTHKEVWIPRSQVQGGEGIKLGDAEVRVSTWFAEKEGIVKKERKPPRG